MRGHNCEVNIYEKLYQPSCRQTYYGLGFSVPMPLLGGIRQRLGRAQCFLEQSMALLEAMSLHLLSGAHGVDEHEEDFRDYVAELFITNTLTGAATKQLYARADTTRAQGVSALSRVGNSGKAKTYA